MDEQVHVDAAKALVARFADDDDALDTLMQVAQCGPDEVPTGYVPVRGADGKVYRIAVRLVPVRGAGHEAR